MRMPAVIALCLLFLAPLHAQQVPTSEQAAAKPEGKSLFGKVSNVFNAPLHPVIKGIVAGGGLGVGVGYDVPTSSRWETVAQAVVTYRRYWSAQLETAYRGDHGRVGAYARIREMPQLSYFGPGTESDVANRTNFLMRDPVVGAVASARLGDWMTAGVRVEELWPDLGRGASTQHPSVEDPFTAIDAPGLNAQPRFGRYQGFADIQTPASGGQGLNQGGRYRIGYALFHDQQFDRFSFTRLDVEARHKFAVFGPHRRLTLHGWMAATDTRAGNTVPFYLQPSLGGTGQIRSVGEEFIGSDGSRGTLRGFDNFRFRDLNLLLLQADYRVPVWGPFDASVFIDAGKVTPRPADLNFSDLKHDYGFSISVMRGANTVARTDFAFGGGEGTKIIVSFGLIDER